MTIQEKFKTALSELIAQCMDAGMHTSEMIEPMEKELGWMRGIESHDRALAMREKSET